MSHGTRAYALRAEMYSERALGVAAGAYAGYAGVTWLRCGQTAPASADDADPVLDRFMPLYDIVNVIIFRSPQVLTSTSRQHVNRT